MNQSDFIVIRNNSIEIYLNILIWPDVPEFRLYLAGSSMIYPVVDGLLMDLFSRIKKTHCENDARLFRLIDLFKEQESNHTAYHRKLNSFIVAEGFEELTGISDAFARDLSHKVKERPLKINAAFCAGFENVATLYTKYLLIKCHGHFATAEPQIANMFLWHFAEELQHRVVTHDVYNKLNGNYWLLCCSMLYASMYIMRTSNRLVSPLLRRHRAQLSLLQSIKSRALSLKLSLRMWIYLLPRIVLMMRPGCHPSSVAAPERVRFALARYSSETLLLSKPF